MFVTSALAQDTAAPAAPGMGATDLLIQFAPILLLVVIFWLLIFRPQQKRQKAHQEMIKNVRRGDTVITTGGLIGKVTKVVDDEKIEVELAPDVRVVQLRAMLADVRAKGEPVKEDAAS